MTDSWFTDRNEFYPADLLVAPAQNLTKMSYSSTQDTSETVKEDVKMREVEEEEEELEGEEEYQQVERKIPRRAAAK